MRTQKSPIYQITNEQRKKNNNNNIISLYIFLNAIHKAEGFTGESFFLSSCVAFDSVFISECSRFVNNFRPVSHRHSAYGTELK